MIGCSESERKTAPKDDRIEAIQEHEKALRVKQEQQQKGDLKTDSAKKNVCSQFSETMIDLKELLELENYKVEIKEPQKDLSFKSEMANEVFQVDETISFPKAQFLSLYAKRKNKLERMEGHWYPSFSVTEICFQDASSALENHQLISDIINRSDFFNEKNYDYVLQNGNRLIYVSAGAKLYGEYAFSYSNHIEEIIKKNQRKDE